MNNQKIKKSDALKAFSQTVCFIDCEKTLKKSNKCIVEEGGCTKYKMFKIKIESL